MYLNISLSLRRLVVWSLSCPPSIRENPQIQAETPYGNGVGCLGQGAAQHCSLHVTFSLTWHDCCDASSRCQLTFPDSISFKTCPFLKPLTSLRWRWASLFYIAFVNTMCIFSTQICVIGSISQKREKVLLLNSGKNYRGAVHMHFPCVLNMVLRVKHR